jgi:hypothetical protein
MGTAGAVCVRLGLLRHMPQAYDRRSCPLPDGERATLFCNIKEWVRGFGSIGAAGNPLTPTLSPNGERERTAFAVRQARPAMQSCYRRELPRLCDAAFLGGMIGSKR